MSFVKFGLSAAFLFTLPVSAQAVVLTWNDCVAKAATSNPALQSALSSYESAQNLTSAAYSNFLPQVAGAINYNYGTTASPVATPAYSTSLTVTQNLFSGLADQSKVDQAIATAESNRFGAEVVRSQVSYDLKSAFASLVYAQDSIKLSSDILKQREDNLRLVQLRFESGRENKGSVLLFKAYLEQAKLDLLQAKNSIVTAQTQLSRVLGTDFADTIVVQGGVPVQAPPAEIKLQDLALQAPDYLQTVAQEKYAEAGVTSARTGFFPTLNLNGQLSDTGSQWYPASHHWTVGASLTFPLFNGGRDFYGVKSAAQISKASSFNRQTTYQQDITKIQQSFASYQEATQRLEVDRAFAEAAGVRSKIAKEQYNNGLLQFVNWDQIVNDYINRQRSYLQSQRERVVQEAAWEQSVGKGVIP